MPHVKEHAMLGVIGLDTAFYKPPGHIRNPSTFDFPSIVEAVPGATTERLVGLSDPSLSDLFVEAARSLVRKGATMITGGCGYMILFQKDIAASVPVPVAMSSLLQLPMLSAMLPPGKRVGVLVANQHTFDHRYIAATGSDPSSVGVWGMAEQPEFASVMLRQDRTTLDLAALEAETVRAAESLVAREADLGCVLFECTDLAPFAARVQAAVALPVYDITTLIDQVYRASRRRPFGELKLQ